MIKTPFLARLPVRMLLILYSITVVFPLIWTVYTSFKTTNEFYENPWSLPQQINFDNYINAFTKAKIGAYFMNSIAVSLGALVLCNLLAFAAAYVIARHSSPVTRWIRRLYMSSLFFPAGFGLIPTFLLLNSLHLLDNRFGLALVYAAGSIPFTAFLLVGFIASISKEYEEAAEIDGCSPYGIMFRIIFPMTRSGLITVTIFNFMGYWNEFISALSFVSTESKRTLTLGLVYLMEIQRYSTDWGALFAGLVIVMLPTALIYAFLQRKITTGINLGGLKG
ncbi:carbohydrate ABC transporter permease [Paenibacillus contaminans]|uniref:Carbohydrate ABC transporter permease n=1 Tax=Paenibacillus contaminans TaxID=450362 RepID=A0A329MNJ5_9BACL|nr:carbohydrate ABC transporter permease [Paenibacillus contaminans]RAV21048.1 carbohydrate ABC transporter permease [Paenibacillus contaminans]